MPFIKLYTNLSKDKLPEKFMPKLVDELSVIINKDKKWFNWILETDKCMSKVSLYFIHDFGNRYMLLENWKCSLFPMNIILPFFEFPNLERNIYLKFWVNTTSYFMSKKE